MVRSAFRVAGLLLPALLAGPAAPAATADGAATPPVLLRGSLFLTPIETAGTGLAPEVGIRLTVDERGRVRDPEILAVTPSSRYDELFREAVLETLDRWRYAPARQGGEPVSVTLEWTVQFRPRSASPAASAPLALETEERLTHVFRLSSDDQAERLRNFATIAERWLEAGQRRRAASDRFVVVSDATEASTAETIAGNLEAVYGVLDATLGDDLDLAATPYKMMAYVYRSQASYAGFTGELTAPEWAQGFYVPPGLFSFHLETGSVDTLLSTMIHEAVHGYVDRHLARPGFPAPPWLVEGLCEYFARSEIRDGRLEPGRVREGRYVADGLRGGAYRQRTETGWSLDELRRALRGGELPGAAELMASGRAEFYGEDIGLHYAASWVLVHYLHHGEPGWAEEEFPDFLLYVLEGYDAEEALERVYGRTPDQLDAGLREHVRSL
jgi:hypothetical protein